MHLTSTPSSFVSGYVNYPSPTNSRYSYPGMKNDLELAVSDGVYEALRQQIANGAYTRTDNEAALTFAVRLGYHDIAQLLLENGADPNVALLQSIYCRHLDIMKTLIENGADITVQNNSALFACGWYGTIDMVKYLLDNGADIHASDDELFIGSILGAKLELIKFLLQRGANIMARDGNILSYCNSDYEIIELLVKNGAPLDLDINDEVLVTSLRKDDYQLSKFLLSNAIHLNVAKINQYLSICIMSGCDNVIGLILDLGPSNETINDLLPDAAIYSHYNTMKLLLEQGTTIEARTFSLINSAKRDNADITKLFIECGVNIHAHNDAALQEAANRGNLDTVILLLQNGADIHANNNAPLKLAANGCYDRVVTYLLQNGADINDPQVLWFGVYGQTPRANSALGLHTNQVITLRSDPNDRKISQEGVFGDAIAFNGIDVHAINDGLVSYGQGHIILKTRYPPKGMVGRGFRAGEMELDSFNMKCSPLDGSIYSGIYPSYSPIKKFTRGDTFSARYLGGQRYEMIKILLRNGADAQYYKKLLLEDGYSSELIDDTVTEMLA